MIGHPHLTDKAAKDLERSFDLKNRAIELLEIVVAEWASDPTSVQCFDLRIVEEAKKVTSELKKLDVFS